MRIAVLSDNFYPELSGISDSAITLAREMARRGHRLHFYVPRYGGEDYRRLGLPRTEIDLGDSIAVTRLSSLPYPTGTGQGRLVLPSGLRWHGIRTFQPDVLHVHLPFSVGLEGLLAACALDAPLIGTNHTPITEFLRYSPVRGAWVGRAAARYTTWFYNRCSFLSSPCRAILAEMEELGLRAPHRVIPNPIRLDLFHPLPEKGLLKRKYGLSDFTLLYAGRLAPEKHLDLILHALAALAPKAPGIDVVLLGSGAAEDDLRSLCRSLGLANRVHFLGYVPDLATVVELYNACELFVIPSTAETQSIAAMQAMACGLPVVGARSWGLKEYISEANGLLVEPGDARMLAEALAFLLDSPATRLRLGGGGREFVARYSVPSIGAEWEAIYQTVCEAHRRGEGAGLGRRGPAETPSTGGGNPGHEDQLCHPRLQ